MGSIDSVDALVAQGIAEKLLVVNWPPVLSKQANTMERTQLEIEIDKLAETISKEGGCVLFLHFNKEDVSIRRAGNLQLLSNVLKQSMEHDAHFASAVISAVGSLLDE